MFDTQAICTDISAATGSVFLLRQHTAIGGGDINEAYCLEGECGRRFFLKLNHVSKLAMFAAEAEGLKELAQAKAIRVPTVICHGSADPHAYIVIEYISFSNASGPSGAKMGQQLAQLHQTSSNGRGHGWHRDNTIGVTPQCNDWTANWVDFLREQRLRYQLNLAEKQGLSQQVLKKGQYLLQGLGFFFESYQPEPSLLHGDLWSGNAGFDEIGQPIIYDPAVYFGDRETDVAMTELFGGFSDDFYDSYEQILPLDPGYSKRRDIYKLYHILNHFSMFGSGYASKSENLLDKLLICLP